MEVARAGGDPGTALASVLLLAQVLAQPQAPGTKPELVGQVGCPGHHLGRAGVPAATLWEGGCSDSPRAVPAERWQRWDSPRALGSGSPGAPGPASAPAAGCPRVNESLLLLQTISDIFADNATLSLCRLPGSTSPAAPAPHAAPSPPPSLATVALPWSSRHRAPTPRPAAFGSGGRIAIPSGAAGSPRCPLTRCCCGNCIPRRIMEPESAGSQLPSKSRRSPGSPRPQQQPPCPRRLPGAHRVPGIPSGLASGYWRRWQQHSCLPWFAPTGW